MESQFLKPPRVMKFGSKNLIESYREIGDKIMVLDWEKGMTFVLIYQKVRNIEGSRNQDSTVHVCRRLVYSSPSIISKSNILEGNTLLGISHQHAKKTCPMCTHTWFGRKLSSCELAMWVYPIVGSWGLKMKSAITPSCY